MITLQLRDDELLVFAKIGDKDMCIGWIAKDRNDVTKFKYSDTIGGIVFNKTKGFDVEIDELLSFLNGV